VWQIFANPSKVSPNTDVAVFQPNIQRVGFSANDCENPIPFLLPTTVRQPLESKQKPNAPPHYAMCKTNVNIKILLMFKWRGNSHRKHFVREK
jgi:hypothetical protein